MALTLKIGKDTVDTWRARFYTATTDNPGDLIGTLLRLVANIADETVDEDTPMEVIFEILRDNTENIAVQAMLSMQFSEMIGKVSANEATADRLAKDVYAYLKDGKPRNKAEIEARVFPGVSMKNNPQGKADLAAAFKLVYDMPYVSRFAQNGAPTDTRWTTIQIVTPESRLQSRK